MREGEELIGVVSIEELAIAKEEKRKDKGTQLLMDEESEYIKNWRAKRNQTTKDQENTDNLVGLALSGGGIRSATFSLGAIQALASRGLFEKIDYLSTVSGGGYIGSSINWFLSGKATDNDISEQKQTPPVFGVKKDDFPYGTDDPAPGSSINDKEHQNKLLTYLRQHGYYLTPGAGITLFSLLGVVLRGTLLNLFVWLPAVILFFAFGFYAADKFETALPLNLESAPLLFSVLNKMLNQTITYPVIVLAGFELFLWITISLAVLLILGTLIYSISTYFKQFFSRTLEPFWYKARRISEKLAAKILPIILVTAIIGTLPIVAAYLQNWLEAVGPLSMVVGIATLMRNFLVSGENDRAGIIPHEVSVSLGAGLFLYGFFLIAYSMAFMISPITNDGGIFSELWIPLLLLVVALGFFVNLNHISIHRFYRDRLMETFTPDLSYALSNKTGGAGKLSDGIRIHEIQRAKDPFGPFHIINTNIVLVNSDIRTYKKRGGDNFIISSLFCGSNATGWCRTSKYMKGKMTLPTAVAISGAAANPNTGVGGLGLTRNLFVSLVMSLLNLRLGYWTVNPTKSFLPHLPNHFRPGAYSFGNAMGWPWLGFDENRTFIQLSDGGHFENTGIYELIRRRSKLIIACDGGADKEFSFSDFQATVRRIEEDFGVQVKVIDPDTPDRVVPVLKEGHVYPNEAKFAAQGHMLGNIIYPDGENGTLIYLKTTLVNDISFKVKAYAAQNNDFPDQTTADQFFDDVQFESYRELGYRLTTKMLGSPAPGKHEKYIVNSQSAEAVDEKDTLEHFIRNSGVDLD